MPDPAALSNPLEIVMKITRILAALPLIAALSATAAFAGDAGGGVSGQRKVCLDTETTGTRMPTRICKTMAEWEKELPADSYKALAEAAAKKKKS
jgi:hypothetical protein